MIDPRRAVFVAPAGTPIPAGLDLTADRGWQQIGYLDRPAGVPLTFGHESYQKPRRPIVAETASFEVDADTVRVLLGIPPGFPMWYRPERLALPAGRS